MNEISYHSLMSVVRFMCRHNECMLLAKYSPNMKLKKYNMTTIKLHSYTVAASSLIFDSALEADNFFFLFVQYY